MCHRAVHAHRALGCDKNRGDCDEMSKRAPARSTSPWSLLSSAPGQANHLHTLPRVVSLTRGATSSVHSRARRAWRDRHATAPKHAPNSQRGLSQPACPCSALSTCSSSTSPTRRRRKRRFSIDQTSSPSPSRSPRQRQRPTERQQTAHAATAPHNLLLLPPTLACPLLPRPSDHRPSHLPLLPSPTATVSSRSCTPPSPRSAT